jgi:hypothetical protein
VVADRARATVSQVSVKLIISSTPATASQASGPTSVRKPASSATLVTMTTLITAWITLYTRNGVFPGTVLADGFVAGTWRIDRPAGAATLTVEPFGKISGDHRAAVTGEGKLLLAFAAPGAAHDIRFALPR